MNKTLETDNGDLDFDNIELESRPITWLFSESEQTT